MPTLIEQQQAAATVVGALAHEVNHPLQGILCAVEALERDCAGCHSLSRLEQIRGDLARIRRIVEGFAEVHRNLPRPPDLVPMTRLLGWLEADLRERQYRVSVSGSIQDDRRIFCMAPELVRLIGDAFSGPDGSGCALRLTLLAESATRMELACERDPVPAGSGWSGADALDPYSGVAVLIDELMKLCGGESTYRQDHATLGGIRLMFRTRMEQA